MVINIVPSDSHSEQCFCSTPKGLSKFKFSVSLSKISKKVGSSNSIQLEGALDDITTEFVLASARNLGYYALELVDGEKMLNRMKFGSNGSVSIELTIKVFPDFHWQICMFSKQLSASKPYLEHLPPLLTVGNIEMFLKDTKDAKLCPGNHDFNDIIFHKISQGADLNFYGKNKKIRAKIENGKLNSYDEMNTIRTIACSILIRKNETRCSSRVDFRKV